MLDKRDGALRTMRYHNTGEVKPAAGVTREHFTMEMRFTRLEHGQQVPESIETHTRGKAFVFKKFDERVVQTCSDYRRLD